jgi:hypothetical protein
MAERKLERYTVRDNRFFLYGYSLLQGFSLVFVSGPDLTREVKQGEWLDDWETEDGTRRFSFGPRRNLTFATKEAAVAVKAELERAVDIITEVVE